MAKLLDRAESAFYLDGEGSLRNPPSLLLRFAQP